MLSCCFEQPFTLFFGRTLVPYLHTVYLSCCGKLLEQFEIVEYRRVSKYSHTACRMYKLQYEMYFGIILHIRADFLSAKSRCRIEQLVIHLAVKVGRISVIHKGVHDMTLEYDFTACCITQYALKRYRILFDHLHSHLLATLLTKLTGTQT